MFFFLFDNAFKRPSGWSTPGERITAYAVSGKHRFLEKIAKKHTYCDEKLKIKQRNKWSSNEVVCTVSVVGGGGVSIIVLKGCDRRTIEPGPMRFRCTNTGHL